MSKRLIWQGSNDNFCGLYCAAHIIACMETARANRHDIYEDSVAMAFFRLLRSAERLGLLTARRIAGLEGAGGFYSPQLVRIFNHLNPSSRLGLEAVAFSSAKFKRFAAANSPADRFRGMTFAIIKESGDKHWIAATGLHRDGGYFCFDPDREKNVTRRERIYWDDGVMVAPKGWLSR